MKQSILILVIGVFFIWSCQKNESNPKITTLTATPTSATSCTAVGQVDERGSYTITDHGFVYFYANSDNLEYAVTNNKISLGKVIAKDTFAANFSLSNGNYYSSGYKWYVKAYITNEKGTIYGNSVSFDPLITSLNSIYPSSAKVGDTITINGNNFDPVLPNNKVQFYNYSYFTAKVVAATRTTLKVIVPDFSGSYYSGGSYSIIVTVGNQNYTLNNVFTPSFSVTSFSPSNGSFNTTINIYGYNFGQISGVMLGSTLISYFSSYSNYISVNVPNNITSKSFKIYVLSGSTKTEVPGGTFVMNTLTLSSFSPTTITPGNSITINGTNFNSLGNHVYIGSTLITNNYYSYSSYLNATIPSSIVPGVYKVSVSNGLDSVTAPGTLSVVIPSITGISPTSGIWGTDLTISGHNLNTNYSNVYFNGTGYNAYSYDSTTFKITIPSYMTPGTYKISLYNGSKYIDSPTSFTLLAPTLTSITPSTGTAGTAVIITGQGFGTSAGNITVKFGSLTTTVSAVNDTQINAIVPSAVGTGSWMVTVSVNGYTITNSLTFSVP